MHKVGTERRIKPTVLVLHNDGTEFGALALQEERLILILLNNVLASGGLAVVNEVDGELVRSRTRDL